jgi:hypothetical protein
MVQSTLWSEEEISILKEMISRGCYRSEITKYINRSVGAIKAKIKSLGIKRPKDKSLWSEEEISILKELYNKNYTKEYILEMLPNRSWNYIIIKARKLHIYRTHEMKYGHVKIRLQKTGRYLDKETLTNIAAKYTTRREFKHNDISAYTNAQKKGFLDEICKHMIFDEKFNYAQNALFEIVKLIFKDEVILYNDRTTINPKELDVYVKNLKIAFEYDGEAFHTKENDVIRDNLKDSICERNNIKLYRIKEKSSKNPIPHIIDALIEHGFQVDHSIIDFIKEQLVPKHMDLEYIKNLISQYKSIKEFARDHTALYEKIHANNLSYLFDGIRKSSPPFTNESIMKEIQGCTHKKQLRKSIKVWIKNKASIDTKNAFDLLL